MILLDKKKPISALKLIHTVNHTKVNRFCDINANHLNFINTLSYTAGERTYDLRAGLYKVIINNNEYIIDVFIDIRDRYSGDFLLINNEYDITLYAAGGVPYYITPYKINAIRAVISPYIVDCVNDSIDSIMITGETTYVGNPSLNNPVDINRIPSINIKSQSGLNSDSLNIPLKYTLGKLPNGTADCIIINADKLISHEIINTSKEVLSGSLKWEYKELYSDDKYYVFFAKYNNVKLNSTGKSIRCSHFESVSCNDLLNKSIKKNCIATSYDDFENGIWIKIAASVLDIHGDKDFSNEMKKWILAQATSNNPIYIEYEIADTIYNTILIDEYHVKTWYPNTKININNGKFSIFYKALKSF